MKTQLLIATAGLALSGLATGGDNTQSSDMRDHSKPDSAYQTGTTQGNAATEQANSQQQAMQEASRLGVEELDDLEDREIVNNQGEVIGEVDRLAKDSSNGEILLVVGLEGVIGDNMKEVAVPIKDVSRGQDEQLMTSLSKSQLQQKRDIDPWDGSISQVIR